ncbi:helix-turn-helix domain-containing protein [Prauserella flavalba]|uniref:helix-turn-helix domain-containing protein n=1 Tax=Prauserella flavalba TaxID=1477506 RepID=UPI0036E67547
MPVLQLGDADRATLLRWARSPGTPQALVLRARIVLACAEAGTVAEVARTLGVSRQLVTRWRARFAEAGPDGLTDRTRPGRPSTVGHDGTDRVLAALLTPPPKGPWSTRSLAAETGLSQSTVSRILRTLWPSGPEAAPSLADEVRHVAGVYFDREALVVAFAGDGAAGPAAPAARDVALTGTQTLFAAVATTRSRPAAPASGPRAFLGAVDRAVPAPGRVVVLLSGAGAAAEAWVRQRSRFLPVVAPTPAHWHAQAGRALRSPALASADVTELTGRLRAWSRAPTEAFSWVRKWHSTNDSPIAPVYPPVARPSAGARLADRVVPVLRESIAGGRFQPGERIKEAPLAAQLGVSRGTVRDALRTLADDGLLDLLPNRGAAVPRMHAADVLETYAARALLGSLLVRKLATRGGPALRPVASAVAEVRAMARRGHVDATAEADLRFQEAMAEAAELPRTALHFNRLGVQLRMFISILGLDYADAVDRMVLDATGIFAALRAGSPEEAAARWRAKVEYAVRYMVAELPLEGFDADLWTTLTGGYGRA